MTRPLKDRMLNRLLGAAGWTQGDDLAAGLSTSRMAIDDALADLVTEDAAEFRVGVGYRYKASQLCRDAMRTLKRERVRRSVVGQVFEGMYRLGIAEHIDGVGLVNYEMEMPLPPDGDDFLDKYSAQMNAFINFATREKANA